MAYSVQQFTSTGTEDHVVLSFPYLDKADIHLYGNSVETTFTWASDNRIDFTPFPMGTEVVIRRLTNRARVRYLLQEGAPFTREILDQIHTQSLYLAQEAAEGVFFDMYGDLDMHGFRVRNASDPQLAKDYTTKQWVESAIQEVNADYGLRQDLAEIGGLGLVGAGRMQRGTDSFSVMQGRVGEHRQDTLTRGLAIELNEPIVGMGAASTYMFNRFRIVDDRVDAQSDGTPGTKVDGVVVQHDFGGAGARGGRHAGEFMLTQKAPTEADNTDRNYVGIVGFCASDSGDGGTSSQKRGAYFGGNFFTSLKNSMYTAHANGCESNVLIDANSSTYYRAGYSAVSGGVNQGTEYDAAYAVGALGASGAQWRDGILMGVQNGRNPISRSMLRGEGLSVPSVATFSGSVPTDIIRSDTVDKFRFSVDRLEMFYPNASLKLGAKDTVNTPVIDAYTDASGNRSGRIIFTGTAPTPDNGVCNVQFRQTTLRELVPSAASVYNCGTTALPWAGGATQAAFTVTSDERTKTRPFSITDVVLDAVADIDWVQFQIIDRILEKGEAAARWHVGVIAQHVQQVFAAHGLDARQFAFFCYDKWEAKDAVIIEHPATYDTLGMEIAPAYTELVQEATPAGELYSIRYEELMILKQQQMQRDLTRTRAALLNKGIL